MSKGELVFAMFLFSITGFCQQQEEVVETRKARHYVGVQANQLLRQLLNFGGAQSTFVNPYLLTYAVNSGKSGVGLNVGFGYNSTKFSSGDPITPRETITHDLAFRMGIERKFTIGKRWFSSYGLDFLVENSGNKTETTFKPPGQPPTITTTETLSKGSGWGPRITLNFMISDKLILGTEASYYSKSSTETQKVSNQPDVTSKPKSFTFSVPAVIFVILKI